VSAGGRRVALLVSAIAVALLGIEIGLRVFAPQRMSGSWMTRSAQGYTVNRPSISSAHVIDGRSAHYRLNSLGFRGSEPPPQARRVLVLGDSATFGWLLDEEHTTVARLHAHAAAEWGNGRVAFMNAAVGGWGTSDYLAFIEDHGDRLRPDAVLVMVGLDDVRRAGASALWALTPGGALTRQPPPARRQGVGRIADLPFYNFLIERSHVAQVMRQAVITAVLLDPLPSTSASDEADAMRLNEALYVRLSAWCRERNIALLVSTGNLLEFQPESERRDPTAAFLATADAFFEQLGVAYLSVARARGPLGEPVASLEIPGDGHPNERGAQLIADTVWRWLRDRIRPIADRAPR
jgi:lysophospholipase L1-like esterase